jgi:hypothetical protein
VNEFNDWSDVQLLTGYIIFDLFLGDDSEMPKKYLR